MTKGGQGALYTEEVPTLQERKDVSVSRRWFSFGTLFQAALSISIVFVAVVSATANPVTDKNSINQPVFFRWLTMAIMAYSILWLMGVNPIRMVLCKFVQLVNIFKLPGHLVDEAEREKKRAYRADHIEDDKRGVWFCNVMIVMSQHGILMDRVSTRQRSQEYASNLINACIWVFLFIMFNQFTTSYQGTVNTWIGTSTFPAILYEFLLVILIVCGLISFGLSMYDLAISMHVDHRSTYDPFTDSQKAGSIDAHLGLNTDEESAGYEMNPFTGVSPTELDSAVTGSGKHSGKNGKNGKSVKNGKGDKKGKSNSDHDSEPLLDAQDDFTTAKHDAAISILMKEVASLRSQVEMNNSKEHHRKDDTSSSDDDDDDD